MFKCVDDEFIKYIWLGNLNLWLSQPKKNYGEIPHSFEVSLDSFERNVAIHIPLRGVWIIGSRCSIRSLGVVNFRKLKVVVFLVSIMVVFMRRR